MESIDQQVVHGALDYGELEQLGLSPEEILDFSVNANPYGPSPLVRQAIAHVAIDRYPDRDCLELRRALLTYEFCDAPIELDSILCGNGTTELIWAIARVLLQPGSKAAILGPTFGEYAVASRASGAQVVEYRAEAACREEACPTEGHRKGQYRSNKGIEGRAGSAQGTVPTVPSRPLWSPSPLTPCPEFAPIGVRPPPFHLDLPEVIAWLQAEHPTVLWLCNPNNPTGTWLNQQAMSQIADACTHIGTALVVDEAYWHFLTPRESFSAITLLDIGTTPNGSGLSLRTCPDHTAAPLIVLRSLTKTHALAGLRLGYAIASPSVIAWIRQQLPSWNVNSFAQAAGVAALADRAHCNRTLAELAAESCDFFHALSMLDVPVVPSRTHFCLIDVGGAHKVRQQLLNRRLLVRDCASFGLPTYIRVATRQRDDWQQFLAALQEVICH